MRKWSLAGGPARGFLSLLVGLALLMGVWLLSILIGTSLSRVILAW